MLEKLFNYPAVLVRHKKAPLFEERDRYLAYRAEDGCAHETLSSRPVSSVSRRQSQQVFY